MRMPRFGAAAANGPPAGASRIALALVRSGLAPAVGA